MYSVLSMSDRIDIFTDGSCTPNPGRGGWAFIALDPERIYEVSGSSINTTNNIMELTACIMAVDFYSSETPLQIFTDSQYVKNGVLIWSKSWLKNGWKTSQKKKVKNKDLWIQLLNLIETHDVKWVWIRGHNNNVYNCKVDRLAKKASEEIEK
jgi:ribonuclease HI